MNAESSRGLTEADADKLLDKVVEFDDGQRFERLKPMTNFRKDDGVARILYRCRRVPDSAAESEEGEMFVMKVKVQSVSLLSALHTEKGERELIIG